MNDNLVMFIVSKTMRSNGDQHPFAMMQLVLAVQVQSIPVQDVRAMHTMHARCARDLHDVYAMHAMCTMHV